MAQPITGIDSGPSLGPELATDITFNAGYWTTDGEGRYTIISPDSSLNFIKIAVGLEAGLFARLTLTLSEASGLDRLRVYSATPGSVFSVIGDYTIDLTMTGTTLVLGRDSGAGAFTSVIENISFREIEV